MVESEEWQIVLLKGEPLGLKAKTLPAVVLSVFRGSICRKPGPNEGRVRAGKHSGTKLPAANVRVLHCLPLTLSKDGHYFTTSVTDLPVITDPSGVVLGELGFAKQSHSNHRLHVMLSAETMDSMKVIDDASFHLPDIHDEELSAESLPSHGQAAADLSFSDRSFTKVLLRPNLDKFMRGLAKAYKEACF